MNTKHSKANHIIIKRINNHAHIKINIYLLNYGTSENNKKATIKKLNTKTMKNDIINKYYLYILNIIPNNKL